MANHNDEFKAFVEDWLSRSGRSQNQLALDTGIGQGLISRWLHPDPRRRTKPSPDSLERLAPVIGKPYGELMAVAGWWPRATDEHFANPIKEESPALLAAIKVLRDGYNALEGHPEAREARLEATHALWNWPRPRPGRPRKPSSASGEDEQDYAF
jgi:transcriptional regulator with XRE-family HTH domain